MGETNVYGCPVVSIIIPFYNAEAFLTEAVESVLAQTYRNWQLILVDDGSADASAAIADDYARRFPDRICHVGHEGRSNRGASASRNLGRRYAQGRYVAYLDADDVWLPNKLMRQVELMDSHPGVGMVVGSTLYWHSWTGRAQDAERDRIIAVGAPLDTITEPPQLVKLLYPLGRGWAPNPSSVIVRTDCLDRVGGWEDRFLVAYTDQAFLIKVYLEASVYISSECWDRYRQHAASSTRIAFASHTSKVRHRRMFFEWLGTYFRERGLMQSAEWRLFRQVYRRYRHPMLSHAERAASRLADHLWHRGRSHG